MDSLMLAEITAACNDIAPIIRVVKHGVIPLVQMGIPILLIVLGTIDLGKAVIASEDKEVKAAQSRLIKRVIYAVAIFFLTTLVILIFNLIGNNVGDTEDDISGNSQSWKTCWDEV